MEAPEVSSSASSHGQLPILSLPLSGICKEQVRTPLSETGWGGEGVLGHTAPSGHPCVPSAQPWLWEERPPGLHLLHRLPPWLPNPPLLPLSVWTELRAMKTLWDRRRVR